MRYSEIGKLFPSVSDIEYPSPPSGKVIRDFSVKEEQGSSGEVMALLRNFEPRLLDLRLSYARERMEIVGNVGMKKPVPLLSMGDGLVKMLNLCFAFSDSAEAVLIDEFENGFHYGILEHVWSFINKVSESTNTQLIATTHSMECVVAAFNAFKDAHQLDHLNVIRLDRNKAGMIEPVVYDHEALEAAIDFGFEVR